MTPTPIAGPNSYSFDPGKYYFLQPLDVGLCIESEAMWKDEWRYNVTIASDHPKHYDVAWLFRFHHYQYTLRGQSKSIVALNTWMVWQNFFSSEKKQSMFGWMEYLSLFKSFSAFPCSSWPVIKIVLFSSCIIKYWITSCTTYLIRNSDTSMSRIISSDWLARIVVNDDLDLTKKFESFSYHKE